MSRKFSSGVKTTAYLRAQSRCQICGGIDLLICSHIHSKSPKIKHARIGSIAEKAYNDSHVRSLDNAIVLCVNCSSEVNSKEGLERISVDYLESLNTEPDRCTSLIPGRPVWVRCRRKRIDPTSYQCHYHRHD